MANCIFLVLALARLQAYWLILGMVGMGASSLPTFPPTTTSFLCHSAVEFRCWTIVGSWSRSTVRGEWMRREGRRMAKSGRSVIAEEIYYITINPMRIENYSTVPAAQPRPFLNISPVRPSPLSRIPTFSSPLDPLFYMFSLMEAL